MLAPRSSAHELVQAQGQPGLRRMGVARRHVDGDDDGARQVRRGQPDVLSDWEGAQVAGVDGDKSMISKGQDQDSASTQWTRANKVQSLWASLLLGRLAWRLAPPCCTYRLLAVFTGKRANRGVPPPKYAQSSF